jgi:hypothetical protein
MTDWNSVQIPSPTDWQALERICQRLWIRIWRDPYVQLNGRSGQTQDGVDIFGQIHGTSCWGGVQCKGRDGRFGLPLTEDELLQAVERAKCFEPQLDEFIVATTANSDACIQAVARKLTASRRAQGLFAVHVLSWPELVMRMQEYYPELIEELLRLPARSPVAARAQLQQLQHEVDSCVQAAADLRERWPRPSRTVPVRIWPDTGPELHARGWLTDEAYNALAEFFEACLQINQALGASAKVNPAVDRAGAPVFFQPKSLLDLFFRSSQDGDSLISRARAAVLRTIEDLDRR